MVTKFRFWLERIPISHRLRKAKCHFRGGLWKYLHQILINLIGFGSRHTAQFECLLDFVSSFSVSTVQQHPRAVCKLKGETNTFLLF